MREIESVEDELDEVQAAYLEAEDEVEQMKLVARFTRLLQEATEIDGQDRIAANVTITNWIREN